MRVSHLGQEDYDRLRPLSYPQTDVFLVCFSVTSPCFLREREGKVVPRSAPPLPRCPLPYRGNAGGFERRHSGDREAGQAEAEASHE